MRLPAALTPLMRRARWVAWRRRHNGAKLPYQPRRPGSYALITDETTWGSYEQAARAAERINGGVGYVIGDHIAALDLDDVRNAQTGVLAPWAKDLVKDADTYTEVTPSGEGVRIIGYGHGGYVHRVLKRSPGKLEIYRDCPRYITVTGHQIGASGLANIDDIIDALIPDRIVQGHDTVIVEACDEAAQEIVKRIAPWVRWYFERHIPVGKRSDVIWRTGLSLRERGATPG